MADRWLWQEPQLKGLLSEAGLQHPHMFDIHGGGIDLVFPHHENEIAQSRCAHGTPVMANVWMHNGFLQVEGEKMSKSLGNFVTINELLHGWRGHKWQGEVIKLAMLSAHYTQPIDWIASAIDRGANRTGKICELRERATSQLTENSIRRSLMPYRTTLIRQARSPSFTICFGRLRGGPAAEKQAKSIDMLTNSLALLGVRKFFADKRARRTRNGVGCFDKRTEIDELVKARNAARKAKNFKEADRIRDELTAMGIQLKDAKDPTTGEIVTTWEVKR